MFYDFLQHWALPDYRAGLELFKELVNENREAGRVIEYTEGLRWDMVSRKITHNAARLKLKRFLAVMANPGLRKKYFGF